MIHRISLNKESCDFPCYWLLRVVAAAARRAEPHPQPVGWRRANVNGRDGGLQRGARAKPEARVMSAARAAAPAASAQETTRRSKETPVISMTSRGRRP